MKQESNRQEKVIAKKTVAGAGSSPWKIDSDYGSWTNRRLLECIVDFKDECEWAIADAQDYRNRGIEEPCSELAKRISEWISQGDEECDEESDRELSEAESLLDELRRLDVPPEF